MTASTLTKSGAGWTTDQWKGYFITPSTANSPPQYFLIVSNTGTVLTVASHLNMTSYGVATNPFQITDFTLKSASALKNTGTNTGAPTNDIYHVYDSSYRPKETTTDMGATEYEAPATRRRPMIVR